MRPVPHFKTLTLIALASTAVAVGCTFDSGAPWGYVDAAIDIEPVGDSGQVAVTDQEIEPSELELRARATGGGGVEDFDPADPPPGFTLCHQGHCHHEDGGIYDYEEIEAGIGVEDGGMVNIARQDFDAGRQSLNSPVELHREFRIDDETSIDEVALTVEELVIDALVDDGDDEYPLEISLAMATRPLTIGVAYDVGPDSDEHQDLRLDLAWPDDLFVDLIDLDDAIDATEPGETITIHGTQQTDLRDELLDRIRNDAQLRWIEQE